MLILTNIYTLKFRDALPSLLSVPAHTSLLVITYTYLGRTDPCTPHLVIRIHIIIIGANATPPTVVIHIPDLNPRRNERHYIYCHIRPRDKVWHYYRHTMTY
jgi:hypothetical protein